MLQFRSQRTAGDLFASREEYLRARTVGEFGTRWLCHAIEHANSPLRNRLDSDGFPWITLVLGSGCLEARDIASDLNVSGFPELVRARLVDRENMPDGTSRAELAREFSRSLIEDRLGPGRLNGVGDAAQPSSSMLALPSEKPFDTFAADLLLATALLTRLYHQVKSVSPEAMRRWGEDIATLDPNTQMADELRSAVLNPLRELLEDLIKLSARTVATDENRMLTSLVNEVRQALYPADAVPTVRSAHVQLMTELAWYFLTQGTTVYPGWSDLLLHLSMREYPSPTSHSRPRPKIVDITQTPDAIMDRLLAVTKHSWATHKEVQSSERDAFYYSAAAVVREQARYRLQVRKADRPPIASAFVTSFDIELEMALWSAEPAEPFVVALPVNVLVGYAAARNRTASTCWLGCVIVPDRTLPHDEQLARLRHPDEWFVLSDPRYTSDRYANLPTVVRLNGCPLIELPRLLNEQGGWSPLCLNLLRLLDVEPPPVPEDAPHNLPLTLKHAVLIDEYAAMQQAAVEFFGYSPSGEVNNEKRYGLPIAITGVPRDAFARFWMVMGVQIGDSGVRYRFATQIASPELFRRRPTNEYAPVHSGAVVNRRVDAAARDLLYWYGFDVIEDRCERYRQDLDHYVAHLREPGKRSTLSTACPIQ